MIFVFWPMHCCNIWLHRTRLQPCRMNIIVSVEHCCSLPKFMPRAAARFWQVLNVQRNITSLQFDVSIRSLPYHFRSSSRRGQSHSGCSLNGGVHPCATNWTYPSVTPCRTITFPEIFLAFHRTKLFILFLPCYFFAYITLYTSAQSLHDAWERRCWIRYGRALWIDAKAFDWRVITPYGDRKNCLSGFAEMTLLTTYEWRHRCLIASSRVRLIIFIAPAVFTMLFGSVLIHPSFLHDARSGLQSLSLFHFSRHESHLCPSNWYLWCVSSVRSSAWPSVCHLSHASIRLLLDGSMVHRCSSHWPYFDVWGASILVLCQRPMVVKPFL